MLDYGLPVLFTMFLWWFSTGAILYLVGMPAHTNRWSLAGATAVLIAAIFGLAVTASDASVMGAYLAFTCALAIWGWVEMTYFMGLITGNWKTPCPPEATAWRRFRLGIRASIYHELAIIGFGIGIAAMTWDAPNQVGLWTFLVLWLMRWSAKLNLFLGVPNLNEEFFPEHLRFLKSFIAKRRMNPLFPVSITVSTILLFLMLERAPAGSAFEFTGLVLVSTLLGLAILEHWFLVLRLPDAALWQWALRDGRKTETTTTNVDITNKAVETATNSQQRFTLAGPKLRGNGPNASIAGSPGEAEATS